MNIHRTLEKALEGKLRALLEEVGWLKGWSVWSNPASSERAFDILASIPLPNRDKIELLVDCKEIPRPSRFPYVNLVNEVGPGNHRTTRVRVLAAPFISPRMAELCQRHGWSWFDLAGNCHINVPQRFLIERKGNKPVHAPKVAQVNLGTREASRVVRALLAPQNSKHRWTQRDLAKHCGDPSANVNLQVSLGLVNKVVTFLREEAFLIDSEGTGFELYDPMGLLKAWRQAYRFDRHQRQGYFTLKQGRKLQEALAGLDSMTGGRAAYAVFSAADFQAPYVRQPKTWLYVAEDELERFTDALEAKPVDSGENMIVLVPDDNGVFYRGEAWPGHLGCTNAVQTYVDLFHSGGRGQEAAEALLEKKLKLEWSAGGLII